MYLELHSHAFLQFFHHRLVAEAGEEVLSCMDTTLSGFGRVYDVGRQLSVAVFDILPKSIQRVDDTMDIPVRLSGSLDHLGSCILGRLDDFGRLDDLGSMELQWRRYLLRAGNNPDTGQPGHVAGIVSGRNHCGRI